MNPLPNKVTAAAPPPQKVIVHDTVWPTKIENGNYLVNYGSDRNSDSDLLSSTFKVVYWGTFSARNSELFTNELEFTFWQNPNNLI